MVAIFAPAIILIENCLNCLNIILPLISLYHNLLCPENQLISYSGQKESASHLCQTIIAALRILSRIRSISSWVARLWAL